MAKTLSFLSILIAATLAYFYFTAEKPVPAPTHRYSADDIFYLRQYVSVRTKTGIVGWIPGQELSLKAGQAAPGAALVTDGTYTSSVSRRLLTHDLDEAAALQAGDSRSQAILAANNTRDKWNADLSNQASDRYTADQINAANGAMARQNTVGNYATALNDRPTSAGTGSYGGGVYYGGVVSPAATPMSIAQILALKPPNQKQ
jgi:hypothetical protein